MERELISKRELLALYEISYGALYRWKRQGLIPEEWFIKKSAPTGQETFFPRELICERMEVIQKQKDEITLEELSNVFFSESEKNAVIVLDTVFGQKRFYLNEIRSVMIDYGGGHQKDITGDIVGGRI